MAILRYILIFSLPLLLLTGCYADFEPTIDTKPVICLNSLITAGEPIEVSVTRTWVYTDPTGEEEHSVSDADVKIFANGNLIGEDYIPQEGDIIRIEAYSNTYGAAVAEVMVPYATPIIEITLDPYLISYTATQSGKAVLDADIRFELPMTMTLPNYKDSNHYYSLERFYHLPKNEDIEQKQLPFSSNISFFEGNFYCKDSFFEEFISAFDGVMESAPFPGGSIFSDRQFEGDTQDLHIGYNDCDFEIRRWDGNMDILDIQYIFKLYSVSESYYNWMNYRWQNDNSIMDELIYLGLAEPIWGYSNVSTGAGVVAARSSSTATISLQDFLYNTLLDSDSDMD